MNKKEKELKMLEKEIEQKEKDIHDLQFKAQWLEAEIKFNEGVKKMGDVKPGCWIELETIKNIKCVGFFHCYEDRDGYKVPVFSLTSSPDQYPYRYIKSIKRVSKKVAMDYIKSNYEI